MITYKGFQYSNIQELCDKLNITAGQYKREYEKCKNTKTALQRCLAVNNQVAIEGLASDNGDDIVEYEAVKWSLRELAKSLKIDFKTLIINLDTMDLGNAIKAGKEAKKSKKSKETSLNSTVQVERTHADNIKRINLLLSRVDTTTDELQYLVHVNKNYKDIYENSTALYQALLLIYHAQTKGENARYLKLKEKIAVGMKKELGYVIKDIDNYFYSLEDKQITKIRHKNTKLFTEYEKSISKAIKVRDILSKAYDEQLKDKMEKMRIEQENIAIAKHKKEIADAVNKLKVTFSIKEEMLDNKQFDNPKDICNIINSHGLTIDNILRYTLNNRSYGSLEDFAESTLKNNKESLGNQIGRVMFETGIIDSRKSYAKAGINGLAKMALEMINNQAY